MMDISGKDEGPMRVVKKTTLNLTDSDLATLKGLQDAFDLPGATATIRRAIQIAAVAVANVNPETRCFHFKKPDGSNALMFLP